MALTKETCVPCRGGEPALSPSEVETLKPEVPEWSVVERDGVQRLERSFKFRDFAESLAFAVRVAMEAEREDHHPSILVEWGRATVGWWTHKIRGLHRNDFVMAAKTDALLLPPKG